MHVVYKTEGGIACFPSFRRVAVIDSRNLSAASAAELQRLVDEAHFFDLPNDSRSLHPGAADYQQYAITVEDAGRHHTVRLADPVENPQLQALIEFLQQYDELVAAPVNVG
jgi:hypothetical protein